MRDQALQPQDELLHPENEYFGCISEDKTQNGIAILCFGIKAKYVM